MKRILILTGRDEYLTTKLDGTYNNHVLSKVDIRKIVGLLEKKGFTVEHAYFGNIDFSKSYKGCYVVYGSSEERGLFYKHYIEDVVYRLWMDGAILIPNFQYLKAHDNKAFQEILRSALKIENGRPLKSEVVGRYKDLDIGKFRDFPYVVKAATGSSSRGVRLVRNPKELKDAVRDFSHTEYYDFEYTHIKDIGYMEIPRQFKIWLYRKLGRSQRTENPKKWFYSNKVVIQEYIEGLESDYKVLYYQGKYYVLNRHNRNNDFRASGSGKFRHPENQEDIINILDFAKECQKAIQAPMISMDIADAWGGVA